MTSKSIPLKSDCYGCRDNFYNGNNPYGIEECWAFKTAKVVKAVVIHRDQRPPYKAKPERKLSCWYGDSGLRAVNPESLTKDGYWK